MENWQDRAIVLSVRPHGENAGVVSVLTRLRGRHAGYVHGARATKMRGVLEPGNAVVVQWSSRLDQDLGRFVVELEKSHAPFVMDDAIKLTALQAACALADKTLPEREPHPGVFDGFLALLESFSSDIWPAAYIFWELALLKELGFGLDLTRCAASGETENLSWVSPRTGCAVSYAAGLPYKERLLKLPGFLTGQGLRDEEEIAQGLKLTGYFLENRVFAQTHGGVPEARLRLESKFSPQIAA